MDFRHEIKTEISYEKMMVLRERLGLIMDADEHAKDGEYEIRSLYFDNISDKALREKTEGTDPREKFRIRLYNKDISRIILEKKSKIKGLCSKQSEMILPHEVTSIIEGDHEWMRYTKRNLIRELYLGMTLQGLRPKTVVDYTRIPFVYGPGNVRVTLDYNIRSGIFCRDILDPDMVTVPVGNMIILEIKWDEYIPDIVRDAVGIGKLWQSSFSKYGICRIYG